MKRHTLYKGIAFLFWLLAVSTLVKYLKRPKYHPPCEAEIAEVYWKTRELSRTLDEISAGSNVYKETSDVTRDDLRDCPETPPDLLGHINVSLEIPSFAEMEKMFTLLLSGGRFRPPKCKARHRVAIIIPYRNRENNLRVLLHNLHPILMRQQIDYGIYLAQQVDGMIFNKARIMNAAFTEAIKQYDYQCFIFHDVDLIPEDDRNLYHCPPKDKPRHMAVGVDLFDYKLFYEILVGGALALTKEQMIKVNGFSNEYWGWGGEDDDMYHRIIHRGFNITRYSEKIARYKMLMHFKRTRSPDAYKKLECSRHRFEWDGLTNLKYQLVDLRYEKLFTRLLFNISVQTNNEVSCIISLSPIEIWVRLSGYLLLFFTLQ